MRPFDDRHSSTLGSNCRCLCFSKRNISRVFLHLPHATDAVSAGPSAVEQIRSSRWRTGFSVAPHTHGAALLLQPLQWLTCNWMEVVRSNQEGAIYPAPAERCAAVTVNSPFQWEITRFSSQRFIRKHQLRL